MAESTGRGILPDLSTAIFFGGLALLVGFMWEGTLPEWLIQGKALEDAGKSLINVLSSGLRNSILWLTGTLLFYAVWPVEADRKRAFALLGGVVAAFAILTHGVVEHWGWNKGQMYGDDFAFNAFVVGLGLVLLILLRKILPALVMIALVLVCAALLFTGNVKTFVERSSNLVIETLEEHAPGDLFNGLSRVSSNSRPPNALTLELGTAGSLSVPDSFCAEIALFDGVYAKLEPKDYFGTQQRTLNGWEIVTSSKWKRVASGVKEVGWYELKDKGTCTTPTGTSHGFVLPDGS